MRCEHREKRPREEQTDAQRYLNDVVHQISIGAKIDRKTEQQTLTR